MESILDNVEVVIRNFANIEHTYNIIQQVLCGHSFTVKLSDGGDIGVDNLTERSLSESGLEVTQISVPLSNRYQETTVTREMLSKLAFLFIILRQIYNGLDQLPAIQNSLSTYYAGPASAPEPTHILPRNLALRCPLPIQKCAPGYYQSSHRIAL